jgi:hypothetical protein
MAETVARRGGRAVLPQDIPSDIVGEVVTWLEADVLGRKWYEYQATVHTVVGP